MQGFFISFEGGEGCGKSTQIRRLAGRLERTGKRIWVTREPGGTPVGERVRHLLKHDPDARGMVPEAELLLFAASRAQLCREVIGPALAEGRWVLADRFLDSTTVYQGVARRLDPGDVAQINRFAVGGVMPDLTFVLDLDWAVAKARLRERGAASGDRMEQEGDVFYEAVRAGYLELAEREPGRVRVVDASWEEEAVAAAIWAEVEPYLKGR